MCSLKDQPYREHFTGPPCRCGIPTAGTEAEKVIQNMFELEERAKKQEKHKIELEAYKQKRLRDMGL